MTSDTARVEVTGHYAGAVSRALAHAADGALGIGSFVLGSSMLVWLIREVMGIEVESNRSGPIWLALAVVWLFLYHWVGLATFGKTPGKLLLGLRVVHRDGSILKGGRAAIRVITLPLSYAVFGLGFSGILLGRERRALHDVLAGSAVVYEWGGRAAELPTPLSAFLARRSDDALPEPAAQDDGAPASASEPAASDESSSGIE